MKIYWHEGSKNIIGTRLRKARLEQNPPLSQANLSAKLDLLNIKINHEAISRIESGDRFVADYELLALSEILNVSLEWLLKGK